MWEEIGAKDLPNQRLLQAACGAGVAWLWQNWWRMLWRSRSGPSQRVHRYLDWQTTYDVRRTSYSVDIRGIHLHRYSWPRLWPKKPGYPFLIAHV